MNLDYDLQQLSIGEKPLILVGLMGCGKSTIGKMLGRALSIPFFDSDDEIEKASGRSISEVFAEFGEEEFRRGELKVISRILSGPQCILATGGGAFVQEETRNIIKEKGVSVWLKADLDILMERVLRKNTRPLLQTDDPRAVMEKLIKERYPLYEKADYIFQTEETSKENVLHGVLDLLSKKGNA